MEYTVDTENTQSGTVINGNWRDQPEPRGIQSLPRTLAHHGSHSSRALRERYADYFVGEGSVPWQTQMIFLNEYRQQQLFHRVLEKISISL